MCRQPWTHGLAGSAMLHHNINLSMQSSTGYLLSGQWFPYWVSKTACRAADCLQSLLADCTLSRTLTMTVTIDVTMGQTGSDWTQTAQTWQVPRQSSEVEITLAPRDYLGYHQLLVYIIIITILQVMEIYCKTSGCVVWYVGLIVYLICQSNVHAQWRDIWGK